MPISTAEQRTFRLRCRTGQSGDSGAGEGYSLAAALLLGNAGMKFSEIANRLTGISTPLVGVSWQPSDLEVSAARRVIAFLEDRRVLYAPDELEVPDHCVRSVLEIRHFLSDELGKHDSGSGFAGQPAGHASRLPEVSGPSRGGWPGNSPVCQPPGPLGKLDFL